RSSKRGCKPRSRAASPRTEDSGDGAAPPAAPAPLAPSTTTSPTSRKYPPEGAYSRAPPEGGRRAAGYPRPRRRGCSSVGRALRSQRRSRRFESAHLHTFGRVLEAPDKVSMAAVALAISGSRALMPERGLG